MLSYWHSSLREAPCNSQRDALRVSSGPEGYMPKCHAGDSVAENHKGNIHGHCRPQAAVKPQLPERLSDAGQVPPVWLHCLGGLRAVQPDLSLLPELLHCFWRYFSMASKQRCCLCCGPRHLQVPPSSGAQSYGLLCRQVRSCCALLSQSRQVLFKLRATMPPNA